MASGSVGVLGPVGLLSSGGLVSPRPPVLRALLGTLAAHAPEPVPAALLTSTIWEQDCPAHPKATLHLAVHRLRRWLEEQPGEVALVTGSDGYRLDLNGGTTDLAEFRTLTATPGGDEAGLHRALALWRGRPFADVPGHRVDTELVEALLAERQAVIRRYARSALGAGRLTSAESLLRSACQADPLDEEAHALLIESLSGLGRTAAALAVYDRVRRRLSAELGMSPGSQLRLAHQRVLNRPANGSGSPGGPAPVFLTGRREALESLAGGLCRERIVTLTGPPGAGKSALALAAANAAALRLECAVTVMDLEAQSVSHLGELPGGPHILLLARCDGQVADVKRAIHALTGSAPGLVVLATAAGVLGMPGEVPVAVGPLEPAAAEELLIRRAAAFLPSTFHGPDARHWVDLILARTGGLPSAIEIAASLLRTLAPDSLAGVLTRDARVLLDGRDATGTTLAARIQRAHRTLAEREQLLLARFARLPEEFGLADAESGCASEPLSASAVVRGLIRLVDQSFVQPVDHPHGRRYRILEPIRRFVAEHTEHE
ncbi:AfsR/SARP family transcriptional regulator [Nonomuraea sp. LPB2021202275-12-8]|uniref:AfsR/SARP family transcriptional regulator n=1 Tax=Nonomuraea sp. LPB2021202275-12-8 TaxID=3120159 RepID=UPI00300D3279